MKSKLEIIDNQIGKFYEEGYYVFGKLHWYSINKSWILKFGHRIGYNYTCPEIYNGNITLKEYFDRDVQQTLKKYHPTEIHITIITNNFQ